MNTGPLGSELTKEPFQWDQRLFAFVLVLPATSSSSLTTQTSSLNPAANAGITDTSANQFIPAAHDQPITAMCDVAGGWEELNIRKSKKSFFFSLFIFGRSYLITTQRALLQCLESLVQKIQVGVVVNLEKVLTEGMNIQSHFVFFKNKVSSIGDTERCLWHSCRKMIMIPRTMQKTEFNWPILEDYWPTAAMLTLPPRSAHAPIKFQTIPCEVTISEKLPFDKYELEPSSLTQYILERRQSSIAWQIGVDWFD
jgi:integrator complex subunit 6